jgi:hypothetical protein
MPRYFAMQLVRALGVVLVLVGILHQAGRIEALRGIPPWAGYGVAAIGLTVFFFLPTMLARRWRSKP